MSCLGGGLRSNMRPSTVNVNMDICGLMHIKTSDWFPNNLHRQLYWASRHHAFRHRHHCHHFVLLYKSCSNSPTFHRLSTVKFLQLFLLCACYFSCLFVCLSVCLSHCICLLICYGLYVWNEMNICIYGTIVCMYDMFERCCQRPQVKPLQSGYTPYHGPLSGGTYVLFRGVFLRNPSWIKLGDRYDCKPLNSEWVIDQLLKVQLHTHLLQLSASMSVCL